MKQKAYGIFAFQSNLHLKHTGCRGRLLIVFESISYRSRVRGGRKGKTQSIVTLNSFSYTHSVNGTLNLKTDYSTTIQLIATISFLSFFVIL